jgi:predicted porin
MKKIFLATTAIAALSVAGAANAAEWSTGVGGYMQVGIAVGGAGFSGNVGNFDEDDGLGILRDGEIHLKAKLVADNGLTFDARVELEATSASPGSDRIDENWARVSGSFGSIKIGGDDSAKNSYNNGVIYAPGARIGYYDGFGLNTGSSQPGIGGAGDSQGIHYDSPNWMGFNFGATYIPNTGTDSGGDVAFGPTYSRDIDGDEFWSVGAAYAGSFDNFGFGISGAYGDAKGPNNDQWHVAGNVSFSGFTVAGGYEESSGGDSDEFYIGARYSTGPWTIAGGYSNQDFDDCGSGCKDTETFAAWVSYAVAPGVTANVGFEHEDSATVDSDVAGMAYMTMSF